jgi:hypothetical protein
MGVVRNAYKSVGRDHSELCVGMTIILKLILNTYGVRVWTGLIWLRIDTSDGCYEHGNEFFGFH